MPELPEVEAARRAIEDHCLGHKITRAVVADDPKVIDGISSSDFQASLTGKTIISACRKGKNMWLQLNSPPFPSFQFGMAGAIYIKGVAVTKYKRSAVKDEDEWPSKYSKVFIELDNGVEFSFTDKRRFARVRLLEDPESVPPISELGPDALLEPMTVEEWAAALSKKKIAIKTLLLDQSFVSGVGNWVADEVLYQARIHPLESAADLSKESCAALHKCIKEVIEKAVEVGADSSQFPSNWIFHSREKKPGKAFVDGKKIDFITAGGRTTAYVPELQKLSKALSEKALNKQKRQSTKKKNEAEDDNSDADEAETMEKTNGSAKSKKKQKPRGKGGKSTKRKANQSDDDDPSTDDKSDDDDDDVNKKKNMTRVKQIKQVTEKTKKNSQATKPRKKQK